MNDQADIHSADSPDGKPAIELIEGVSSRTRPASRAVKWFRFSLYGLALLVAATLTALVVRPETALYLTFVPEPPRPQLDPEVLAEVVARQEAYLQSYCVTGIPPTPSHDNSAAEGESSVAMIGTELEEAVAAGSPDSESSVLGKTSEDAASAESQAEDASLPAN